MCDCKLAENCLPLVEQNYLRTQKKLKKENKLKKSCLLVNTAVLSLSLITFIIFWFTNIYDRLLLEKIILSDGSEMLTYWIKPPIDPILKIYVFNYTNIDNVLSGVDKRMNLSEVGPYVYRERVEKTGLRFEGHRITFYENRSHEFVPHLSGNLREDDVVLVPNLPLISAIPNVKSLGFFAELGFKSILASTKPKEFNNLTIANYLFGYTDSFMKLVSRVKWDFNPEDVGILAPKRGITKKSVTVDSGVEDVAKVGQVYAVGDQPNLKIWKSDECNRVTGSDGVIYGPAFVQKKEDIQVYLPSFCRSLPLVFDKETKVMNGMQSYRYKAPFGTFSSPDNYPSNKFYCELKSMMQKHIDGVLDVSSCVDGNPPIFISHPHFMEGDTKLFKHFKGLKPKQSLHESFVHIHKRLSVPLFGVSRMQLNLKLNHFGNYYKNIPDEIILPLAWIETTTEEFPDNIKTRLFLSTVVVDFVEVFFRFSSLFGIIASLVFILINQIYTFSSLTKIFSKFKISI